MRNTFIYGLSFICLSQIVHGVELTFDLPDSSRECFHQEVKANQTAVLEFQVKPNFDLSILFYLCPKSFHPKLTIPNANK